MTLAFVSAIRGLEFAVSRPYMGTYSTLSVS